MIESYSSDGEFCVGVVADTHIPDRERALHPALLEVLRAKQVQLILHAGDISIPRVLTELTTVAPVLAVKGNRDFTFGAQLPLSRELVVNGQRVLLTHGHMGAFTYWVDKFQHLASGYQAARYITRLTQAAPEAAVYIFGHSHCAEEIHQDGKLFFNPGSACFALPPEKRRSCGLLYFSAAGVRSQIVYLDE